MRRWGRVGTRPDAATVAVPWTVPVPEKIAAVTFELSLAMRLPNASSTSMTGCVENAEPAVAPAGSVVTASFQAPAGATGNEAPAPAVTPHSHNRRAVPTQAPPS